jgi:hypothetical protein
VQWQRSRGTTTGNTGEVIWVAEYTDAPGSPLVVRGTIPGLEMPFPIFLSLFSLTIYHLLGTTLKIPLME